MPRIDLENDQFVFYAGQDRTVLLDFSDFMANKSRLPMSPLTNGLTILQLIIDLNKMHEAINEGTEENGFAAFLQDILLTSYIIRTSVPLKVLEIGAVSGVLSYHLATLLGRMNKESHLCCVSNMIGNESENHWLDRISMVEQLPKLSMVVSDYDDTQLQANNYDIVVLNGTVLFDNPYEIIREAERLVKKGGILMCHAKEAPLLESCFKLIFSEVQEYEIDPQEKILVTTYPGYSWGQEKEPDLGAEVSELCKALRQALETVSDPAKIRPYVRRIDECVDIAINNYDVKRKVELIQLKELVLDYMLNMESEFGEVYKERCFRAVT